ncbi:PKD domain-containing protein [Paenibacillus sp. GCM10012303]|uniref:glycoside hydrolase family 78 protein n=1 Tax=Paenibacillus sp. GCM10012303 TaxID=3317340 RepID=UPI003616C1EF
MMAYFAAFTFDLEGRTYQHPTYITVTYEDNVLPEPDIADIKVTAAQSCILVGVNMSFYVSLTNHGAPYSGSFNAKVSVDGTVIKTIPFNGIANGEVKKDEFLYKFTAAGSKTFTVTVDTLPGEKNTGNNSKTFSFEGKASCSDPGPDPEPNDGPEVITGDFMFAYPSPVEYGKSQVYRPLDVSVKGKKDGNVCILAQLLWTSTQGSKVHTEDAGSNIYSGGISGPPYPAGIGGGIVNVTMKITSSCGSTKVVTKSFEIVVPSGNSPPVFFPGWFAGGNSFAFPSISQVVVGSYVDLGIIHNPMDDPPTPYDPEGDGIIYYFDFKNTTSTWLKQLYEDRGFWSYDEHFRMLKADVLGSHSINVCAQDVRGADAGCKTTTLNVVPPEPIPVITGGDNAVEGRPIPVPFSCANSYTPFGEITSCIWGGDKRTMYPESGYYTVYLDVFNSAGLKNLPEHQASKTIYVRPDLPPVPDLDNPGIGIRNVALHFREKSYSPDDDPMFISKVSLMYDSNNDGSFSDEAIEPVELDTGRKFSLTPTKVGKYAIRVFAQESVGYKKSATKDFYFEVINEAPEAPFYVKGSDFQPPQVESKAFSPETLLYDPSWTASSISMAAKPKEYNINSSENALEVPGTPISQGLAPTNSNITSKVLTWGCGDSLYGNCWGLGSMLKPYVFTGSNANGWLNLNSTASTISRTQAMQNHSSESIWPNSYVVTPNFETGRVMFRSNNRCTCNTYGYYYHTYVFNISDVENAAFRAQGGGTPALPTPLYFREYFVSFNTPNYDKVLPPDPPTNIWTYPAAKPMYEIGPVSRMEGLPVVTDQVVQRVKSYANSRSYGTDYNGNPYVYACYLDNDNNTNWQFPYACDLQKKDQNGNLLWTIPKIRRLYRHDAQIQNGAVEYVTADNNKAIISVPNASGGERLKVFDNNTGALLYEFSQPGYGSPSQFVTVHDKIIYWTTTIKSADDDVVNYYNYMNILDLNTFSTVSVLAGESRYYNEDAYFIYGGLMLPATVTADGKILFTNHIGLQVYDLNGNKLTEYTKPSNIYGFTDRAPLVMEDGTVVIEFRYDSGSTFWAWVVKTDVDPHTADLYNFGQLSNPNETLDNGEVAAGFKLNHENFANTVSFGLSARMVDHRNMYRLEVTDEKSKIVKIVDGVKTTLQEVSYPISKGNYYDVKLKLSGDRLKGYVGGVPLLDVTDSTFSSGMMGPYSEVAHVMIKGFHYTKYIGNEGSTKNTAIVGAPVEYVISYFDLENDPAITDWSRWTFDHVEPNKFLDVGDGYSGLSAFHGQMVTSPHLIMDKVGRYKVSYQVPDDPSPAGYEYPNGTFGSYRKYSDLQTEYVMIHRRPIAVFTVAQNPDYTIGWTDTSYDPDRWLAPWYYSTEATGIDYAATRGVMERRYSYTDPDGITQFGKLTRPQKKGTYTVRLSVKDEYGAWSDWAEQMINVSQPVPNTPPTVLLTFPSGSQSSPSYVNTLQPRLTWNQYDIDPDTTFAAFHLIVRDEWGNVIRDTGIKPQGTTSNTAQWTLDTSLTMGQKYQVQVRVSDGNDWSDWSNIGWLVTNRPPEAAMMHPSGSQAQPTVVSTIRPVFQWSQTDPDPGTTFHYFELEVWNEANDTRLLTSGQHWQGSTLSAGTWTAGSDLPAGQKLRVRVRVHDGYVWSGWSADTWLYVNRAPVPDFDWTPKPIWEGDTVYFKNLSSDPDGDVLTSRWDIETPVGDRFVLISTDALFIFSVPGVYTVTLTVSDGYETVSTTKTPVAAPLTILSDVSHTPQWRDIHEAKGHNTTAAPKDFYSGEVFVVQTESSPAPVAEAVAWIDTVGKDGGRLFVSELLIVEDGSSTRFSGRLFDERWMSVTQGFPEAEQIVHFRIRYQNGVVKTEDIPLRIIGNIQEAVQVHRRQ